MRLQPERDGSIAQQGEIELLDVAQVPVLLEEIAHRAREPTGARRGEMPAPTWSCLDLDKGSMRISAHLFNRRDDAAADAIEAAMRGL